MDGGWKEEEPRRTDAERAPLRNERFRKYVEPNLGFVRSLCEQYSFSPSTVEDNYSAVLTCLYLGADTYDEGRKLSTWLHICTKRCVVREETRRRRLAALTDASATPEDAPQASGDGGWRAMEGADYSDWCSDGLKEALDALTAHQRAALMAQAWGGSLKDLPKALGLPDEMYDHLRRQCGAAKAAIRKKVDRDGNKRRSDG